MGMMVGLRKTGRCVIVTFKHGDTDSRHPCTHPHRYAPACRRYAISIAAGSVSGR